MIRPNNLIFSVDLCSAYVYAICMKKSVVYPDWVEKYRGKGRTIRKVRNGYGLYACTSTYSPGQKYPKSVSTYLGMITEKDGFIPKKTDQPAQPVPSRSLEYGLSHFILSNFKRDLMRSVYEATEITILFGMIQFIFDDVNEVFIRSCYACMEKQDEILERFHKGISLKRMKGISSRIDKMITEKIPDQSDRNTLIKLLFLTTISENGDPSSLIYPTQVTDIAQKYGVKL